MLTGRELIRRPGPNENSEAYQELLLMLQFMYVEPVIPAGMVESTAIGRKLFLPSGSSPLSPPTELELILTSHDPVLIRTTQI